MGVFGTLGYARTWIGAASAAASLNSRYFYETFSSREALLYYVYERIVVDIFTRASEAIAREKTIEAQARAGLPAGCAAVPADRRKRRLVGPEVPVLRDRPAPPRRDTRPQLPQLVASTGEVVDHCETLLTVAAYAAVADGVSGAAPR